MASRTVSLGIAACLVVGAWAPSAFQTVVRVRSTGVGLEFSVNGQALGAESLELTTLEHAIQDNPLMQIENVYADALIMLCPHPEVPILQVKEVEERLVLEGFGNIRVGNELECAGLP